MNGSAILIIASIIYSMCLFFVYRSKQHIDTVEHKIFSFLISLNFVGLINELLNYILVLNFIEMLFMVFINFYNNIYVLYNLYIVFKSGKNGKVY